MQNARHRNDPVRFRPGPARPAQPVAGQSAAGRTLVLAACLVAWAIPSLAQVTAAPPEHVPGPVSPSSGKAAATPTTSPIPGSSTTGNATGPDGTTAGGTSTRSPDAPAVPAHGTPER